MVRNITGCWRRGSALLLLLLTLGACTEYAHIPPPGPQGQACVSQCGFGRQQCQAIANQDFQQCQASRNFALASYNRCVRSGQRGCVQPPSCFSQSYRCSGEYDECFRSCGGRIEEIQPRR
jgi:hypothetical protein